MPIRRRAERPVLPSLTFRGWALLTGALISAIVAYASGWRELLFIGLTLVLVVAGSLVVVGSRPTGVRVRRRLTPAIVGTGDEVGVGVEVANTSWIPLAGVAWADVVPVDLHGDSGGRLPALAPRGRSSSRARLEYSVVATRRGLVTVGPLALRATDPFGLCRHDSTVGGTDELIVLPRIERLDGGMLATSGATDSAVRAAMAGRGQDDVIAREYRTGDALRHVHWRATAHRGELMVRQEQRQDEARAVVLLDNRREAWRSTAAFEWAVAFAASVVVHLSSEVAGVDLVLTAPDAAAPGTDSGNRDRSAREVLLDLATVIRRVPGRSGSHLRELDRIVTDAGAPLVAVMGDIGSGEWREIAARRGARGSGIAVFVDPTEVPLSAWGGGWQVASVEDPATPMESVWRGVAAGVLRG